MPQTRSTGLKCVAASKILRWSAESRSTCADSTICFVAVPPAPPSTTTQYGPPPGSPVLRTMPQTRIGRSSCSVANARRRLIGACAMSGAGLIPQVSRNARAAPTSVSPAPAACNARRCACAWFWVATRQPPSTRFQCTDPRLRWSAAMLSMFLTNTTSPRISFRLASSAPWPPGRNTRRPSSSLIGTPAWSTATVSVSTRCVEKVTSKRASSSASYRARTASSRERKCGR